MDEGNSGKGNKRGGGRGREKNFRAFAAKKEMILYEQGKGGGENLRTSRRLMKLFNFLLPAAGL